MKKRRFVATVMVMTLLAGVLSACSQKPDGDMSSADGGNAGATEQEEGTLSGEPDGVSASQRENAEDAQTGETLDGCAEDFGAGQMGRPMLIATGAGAQESGTTPCVEPWTVEPDLSNVENLWQFYLQEEMAQKLAENGFVVAGDAGREFFEQYETNRYEMIPNFVTVDAMMNTYHLYFGYLLKNVEREALTGNLLALSRLMLEESLVQYEQLKGSEWESAAARNVAFFAVGRSLLDGNTDFDECARDMAEYELDQIYRAEGIAQSVLTGDNEDYTQYIPRGYYEGDETLERYFRAMMWYGRVHFRQENEDMDRSALLISLALSENPQAYSLWECIYAVTSFFAGASDDLGVCEYLPLIREVYGETAAADLAGKDAEFTAFHAETAGLMAPLINSIPIEDGEENEILGFRFMGQRFTIDGAIMQKLIYSQVKENPAGERRMLPDVLDVPAALGSEMALEILKEQGVMEFSGYPENMERLREAFAGENDTLWSASLYAGWLNTLRPLLAEKGEGYPSFMRSSEWWKKDLECFAGSFTELKHDTVLYTKQVIAETGDGYDEEPDDRGYVEPEPLVYARFERLAALTAQGLEGYGMLSALDQENLERLSDMAEKLREISDKELADKTLTQEEYEFIRSFGGNIEHFWYEAVKEESSSDSVSTQECPAAIVVDIATDPDGQVLEAATGNPSYIYVIVKVDGKLKIARGSVYSFYQFPWPLQERLTDSRWRQMMGIQSDENGSYNYDNRMEKPEWTRSYRYEYEWE